MFTHDPKVPWAYVEKEESGKMVARESELSIYVQLRIRGLDARASVLPAASSQSPWRQHLYSLDVMRQSVRCLLVHRHVEIAVDANFPLKRSA